MLHGRDILSAIELAFYIPMTFAAISTCFRHGFNRSSGWVFTLILCVVRIAGAICQFLLRNNHSDSLITTTIIIDSIGLSPLLLATLGMLGRFVDSINTKTSPSFAVMHFRVLQLLITIGLILSIVGGTSATTKPDGEIEVETTSKAGIALYIVAYVGLVLVYLISVPSTSVVLSKERRVPVAILFALPLVFVRLIYSACSVFLHSKNFNIVTGSIVVLVAMAVVEEFLVVTIYIVLGFLVDKLGANSQGPITGRQWKMKKGRYATRIKREGRGELGA